MKAKRKIILIGVAAAAVAQLRARADDQLTPGELFTHLTSLIQSVDPAARKALEAQEKRSAAKPGIGLHTVGVGLMSGLSVGLGPIVQASVQPEILLFFTKAEEPIFP